MSEYNDELFALRINFQDSLMDEMNIIRELKIFLQTKNKTNDEINKILLDFYKSYNINFTEDFISNIQVPSSNINPTNIASFLLNTQNYINNYVNNQELESDDDESDEDDSDGDSVDEVLNQNLDSDDDVLNQNLDSDDDIPNTTFNNFMNLPINPPNNNSFFSMSINNGNINFNTNNLPNINNAMTPDEFLNSFTNLLNMVNIPNPNNMEDVKVTLDDEAVDKIKSEKLTEDLNEKCSICMMDMKKDEEYSKLPCQHNFHTDCVMKWLKEYNYKCPVCREECGQAKYHV